VKGDSPQDTAGPQPAGGGAGAGAGARGPADAPRGWVEGRFLDLAAAVPVGVFRSDGAGNCVYVNARLAELTGRPAAEFAGEGWVRMVHPDDRRSVRIRWGEAVARGAPYRDEFRFIGADGDEVWVYAQAVPERADGHRITGYIGSCLDVTARRRAEEALEALAASSAVDLEGFLKDSVRQLARAYGVRYATIGLLTGETPERVRTLAFWFGDRCAPNVSYALAGSPCADVLAGRLTLVPDGTAERYPEDRALAEMEVRSYFGNALVGADGRPMGIVNVMDVRPLSLRPSTEAILGSFARRIAAEVERHRAEARLKAEEWRLGQAQRMAGLGHWEYDLTRDTGTVSEEGWRILGRPPEGGAMSEEGYLTMVHPDDRDAVRARMHAILNGALRESQGLRYRIVRPEGEVRHVHDQLQVIRDEATGAPARVLGTMQDVTDQHRAQEAMGALAASSAVDLESFLKESVRQLARAYGARYAFVGLLTNEAVPRVRTLAFWVGDGFAPNVTYDLDGTPCRHVADGNLIVVPDRVPERFPTDLVLAEMGVESYFGSPLLGAGGTPIGLVSVLDVRPLTLMPWTEAILGSFARRIAAELERHRADSVRATSERELAAILEHLQDTYFRTDLTGRLTRVSPSATALLGQGPDDLSGRHVEELLWDPADLPRFLDALAARGGAVQGYEVALRHRDGHEVWVAVNAQRVPGRHGDGRGVEGTARDITGGRRLARALAESEARLAQTQAIAHLGSWEWDVEGGTQTWSDETYRIYGLEPDSPPVAASRFVDAVHPEDRERVERALKETVEDGRALRVDHRIVRPDGTCRMVRQIGVARARAGAPARVLGAVQDITDLARAESDRERFQAQLLQAQKMEAVGLLAGGVAHDFNNLLTTISGYAELALSRGMDDGHPALADLTEIRLAAERAAALTRQLLLFSRRQPMDFVLLDVADRLGALLSMLDRIIGEGVAIRADLGRGLWPVRADGVGLDQMIMNLAINARDAMPDGGEITIAATNVEVSGDAARRHPEAAPGRYVRLSVADTGVGMDADTLARVFEPFFTTKELGKGTGLGMSVAHGIAKQHGGWIAADSRLGAGTTFHVYLPAADGVLADETAPVPGGAPPLEGAPPEPQAAPRGEGLSVLVVEDEEQLRAFARMALERNGYRVRDAATAREARALFEAEDGEFDLVLSDVVLPDGSGLALVEEFRAVRPGLRVLLSSGYPDPHAGWGDIRETGIPFVQKPYALSALLDAVARTAAGRA
jgi:two-component system cell cycle sensor histidine kinase/response regulator CckA